MRPLPRSLVRQLRVRQARGGAATLAALGGVLVAPLLAACASSGAACGSADPVATTVRSCPAASSRQAIGAVLVPGPAIGTTIGAARGPSSSERSVTDPRVAIEQICAMMRRSAAAWNRGDLDAFMADYLPSEGTTFVGSKGVVRGPSAIRERYAPRFAPGGVRDSLSFEFVEVDLLAPDVANTIAFYVLARGDSVVARGPTSLVMRRVNGSWKIVHDHSS